MKIKNIKTRNCFNVVLKNKTDFQPLAKGWSTIKTDKGMSVLYLSREVFSVSREAEGVVLKFSVDQVKVIENEK